LYRHSTTEGKYKIRRGRRKIIETEATVQEPEKTKGQIRGVRKLYNFHVSAQKKTKGEPGLTHAGGSGGTEQDVRKRVALLKKEYQRRNMRWGRNDWGREKEKRFPYPEWVTTTKQNGGIPRTKRGRSEKKKRPRE